MNNPEIPIIDPWWTLGLGLAKIIVNIYKDSDFFTLTNYEMKKTFYDLYMEKFEKFAARLNNISNIPEYIEIINNIRRALVIKNILNFTDFLIAYCQIFYFIDIIKEEENPKDIVYMLSQQEITINTTPDEIINIFKTVNKKYPYLVPFISKSGVFGFNTFLYLFFNGLFPIAASITPYTVHKGYFKGLTNVVFHDLLHLELVDKIYYISEENRDYIIMKELYNRVLEDKNNYDYDTLELIILFLYEYIHEKPIKINCSKNIGSFEMSLIDALVRIRSVNEEMNNEDFMRWFNYEEITTSLDKFVLDKMNDIKNILCQRYKNILSS